MRNVKTTTFKRITAYILMVSFLLAVVPLLTMQTANAATPHTRVVDASTMTDWQKYFGQGVLNTENAGGIWGDKSVFLSPEDFNNATEDGVVEYPITMQNQTDNFLVALSAMASTKSVVGYSALPTDTIFVVDVTGSMSEDSLTTLVDAVNRSMKTLLSYNGKNNRVGVIAYSALPTNETGDYALDRAAKVLLPLAHYEGETFLTYQNHTLSVAKGVLENTQTLPTKTTRGDTYLQAGIQLAVDTFRDVAQDVIVQSGPQAGTVRIPALVLMSDGAPTVATTNFNQVGLANQGDGSASNSLTAYLTQLTCAWAKQQMSEIYGRSPLFYTTGLMVESSATARAVLEPMATATPYSSYWSKYSSAQRAGAATLEQTANNTTVTLEVVKGLQRDYVDRYFPAQNNEELASAFDGIVNRIRVQSKYYPTLVENGQQHVDGYITFNDELGLFMEVKDIKGLTVHNTLYRGSAIVREMKNGTFGDIYQGNLNNLNSAGTAFLAAVEKRLGCSHSQALEVVSQALKAGQLSYTNEETFSNYIGWYADEEGNFIGFWNGQDHESRPSNGVYANKSYGFMGQVSTTADEYADTDMLHISVQVRTHIDLEHQMVLYKIPASLIPYVHYNIAFDGDDMETATNLNMEVKGAKEALRLIFEVGLQEGINPVNVAEKIAQYEQKTGEVYPYKENGVYHFYTNTWQEHTHTAGSLTNTHDSTWLVFEPSQENERYYYTVNSPIYAQNGDQYTLVTADPRGSSQTHYTKVAIYSTEETGLTKAQVEYRFVPIKAETLQLAKQGNGGWYIPKGTVHRLLEDSAGVQYQNVKAGEDISTPEKTHPTASLDYSNYPAVVFLEDGSVHCDACLGNNGRLTLTPDQGIALENTMEVEGLGKGVTFPYTITLTPPSGSSLADQYPLYNQQGEFIKMVDVVNGTVTLSLDAQQKVYLVSLPTGTTYTVTQAVVEGYQVLSAQNKTGEVAQYAYNQVAYQNTVSTLGNLFLHNDAVIDPAAGKVTYQEPFAFEVEFTGDLSSVTVNGNQVAVEQGKLQQPLLLNAHETAVFSNLPNGVTYTFTQVNLPKGWKAETTAFTGTVTHEKNTVATVVNTYIPEKMKENLLHHQGVQEITGRDWLPTDAFSYRFEYFNGTSWIAYSETQSVKGTGAEKTFSFDELLSDFVYNETLHAYTFNKAGIYQFRVVEEYSEIGGIHYDYMPKRFQVEIANNFQTGSLEVAKVTTVTPKTTAIEQASDGTYTITTTFTNQYMVSGTASFTLNIQKEIENQTNQQVDLSGYSFELYQVNQQGQKVNTTLLGETDEQGQMTYKFFLNADDVGSPKTYYLAEIAGNQPGMTYATTPVSFTVEGVDNLNGSFSAQVNGTSSSVLDITMKGTLSQEELPPVENPPEDPSQNTKPSPDAPQEQDPDSLPPKTSEPLAVWVMVVFMITSFGLWYFLRKKEYN